jgi:hypothetical protein
MRADSGYWRRAAISVSEFRQEEIDHQRSGIWGEVPTATPQVTIRISERSMSIGLFRQEAIDHQRIRIWGEGAIAVRNSYALLTGIIAGLALATASAGDDRLGPLDHRYCPKFVHGARRKRSSQYGGCKNRLEKFRKI